MRDVGHFAGAKDHYLTDSLTDAGEALVPQVWQRSHARAGRGP
jgi:hypothetical protein